MIFKDLKYYEIPRGGWVGGGGVVGVTTSPATKICRLATTLETSTTISL